MIKRSVLVTGGAGYIGSHAVIELLDAGYSVVVLDNLCTGFRKAVDPRAAFVEASVEDDAAVEATICLHNVSAILHFAGSVVVPESIANPIKYYRNNTIASAALIHSAVRCGVSNFIFSSTAAIYGPSDLGRVDETTRPRPINPYGHSKLMTEQMLQDVAIAHSMNHCILRYFNVAGADPAGRVGQSTAGATHLIKAAVECAIGKRSYVSVFGTDYPTPDGTGVRDYIHVSDLAAAHRHALEALIASPKKSHTLNCGYGRGYSVFEVLDMVEQVSGVKLGRRMEQRRSGDAPQLVAANEAILKALPWRPAYNDLETIVRHALSWEKFLHNTSMT
jgi:UDP-glucose 4-epimerase